MMLFANDKECGEEVFRRLSCAISDAWNAGINLTRRGSSRAQIDPNGRVWTYRKLGNTYALDAIIFGKKRHSGYQYISISSVLGFSELSLSKSIDDGFQGRLYGYSSFIESGLASCLYDVGMKLRAKFAYKVSSE